MYPKLKTQRDAMTELWLFCSQKTWANSGQQVVLILTQLHCCECCPDLCQCFSSSKGRLLRRVHESFTCQHLSAGERTDCSGIKHLVSGLAVPSERTSDLLSWSFSTASWKRSLVMPSSTCLSCKSWKSVEITGWVLTCRPSARWPILRVCFSTTIRSVLWVLAFSTLCTN